MTTKKHIIDLAKKLMKIESVASNIFAQHACLDLLEAQFGKDFLVKKYVFNGHPALVLSTTAQKRVDIILSGHIDVVPGDKKLFKPKFVDSKLYGRGAYDMKASVVACAYAVQEYQKQGGTKDIALLITSDEETSGYSTQMLLKKEGYRAKFAFIADGGTETGIVLKQKGFMQLKVSVSGKSAHVAYVWDGDNALVKALTLQKKIDSVFPPPTRNEQWRTSVVLSRVETMNAMNQIPGSAIVYFDIRYVDDQDPKKIIALLKREVGAKGLVEVVVENGMFSSEEKNVYVEKFAHVVQDHTKKPVSFVYEHGTSDAIFFTEHGVPATLYRPKGGGAHQENEWVDGDSLYTLFEIVVDFLRRV